MRVLGVLAGSDMPPEQLRLWAASADLLAAADGGANSLARIGIAPHAVVGDLDSIEPALMSADCIYVEDQSMSDCDKLLRYFSSSGIDSVTLANVEGDRFDHMLATLLSASASNMSVRLALRKGLGYVLKGSCVIQVPPGATISLVPIRDYDDVDLLGVRWELRGSSAASLSNVALGDQVEVRIGSGSALLVVTHATKMLPTWPEET
jgi:thiamine pyrophosphokinase